MHRIFVYGTLKRGQRNHYLLNDSSNGTASFISTAKLSQPYPVVIKEGVPFLLPEMPHDKPQNIVYGELYEVDDSMLTVLDGLEEHPIVYYRTPTQCIITETDCKIGKEGDSINCEVYFFNQISDHLDMYSYPYISDYKDVIKERKKSLKELLET